jgi:hypothetical protein
MSLEAGASSGTMVLASGVLPVLPLWRIGPGGFAESYFYEDIRLPAGEFVIDFRVEGLIRYYYTANRRLIEEFGPGGASSDEWWLHPGAGSVYLAWEPSRRRPEYYQSSDRGPNPVYTTSFQVRGPGLLRVSRTYLATGWTVSTYAEGEQTFTISATPVAQASVQLSCRGDRGQNRVTRGKEMVCSATKHPADAPGELTVVQWTFDGRQRSDGDPASPTWRGPMAQGGEVSLRARIGTGPVTDMRAQITVDSRNWTDHLPPARVERKSCDVRTPICPQTRMVEERDAGLSYIPTEEIGVTRFRIEPIVEGPNAGWWFVGGDEPPITLPSPVIRLNPGVFDPRNSLYFSARTCRPEDVQYWITTHENEHIEIGQERAAAGYINGALEGRTAYRPINDTRFYDQTVAVLRSRVATLLDRDHTLENRYPAPPCDTGLKANTRP